MARIYEFAGFLCLWLGLGFLALSIAVVPRDAFGDPDCVTTCKADCRDEQGLVCPSNPAPGSQCDLCYKECETACADIGPPPKCHLSVKCKAYATKMACERGIACWDLQRCSCAWLSPRPDDPGFCYCKIN